MNKHHLKKIGKIIEKVNSKLVGISLILLFLIIIYELFFQLENELIQEFIEIADYFIIGVFTVDLLILAKKAKSTKYFFKNYWLDILAIFPFGLLFKTISLFSSEGFSVGQAIFHESLEVGKTGIKAERFSKIVRLSKTVQMSVRVIRLVSKSITRFKRKKIRRIRF